MKYFVVATLAAVGCLLTCGGQRASAQFRPTPPVQVTNPAYSPYLNLFRPGTLFQNYFGLVQPELQWRNSVQNLQGQVMVNNQAIGNLQQQATQMGPPATGHAVRFNDFGGAYGGRGGRR